MAAKKPRARARVGGRRRIAVVMGTGMNCYREVIRGINAFSNAHQRWHVDLLAPVSGFVGELRTIQPDGVLLGPLSTSRECAATRDLVPFVVGAIGQHSQNEPSGITEVEADDFEVGRIAAKYFIEKGYKHFAYVGTAASWSLKRQAGFVEQVKAEVGREVAYHNYEDIFTVVQGGWERPPLGASVLAWLQSLPRPLALLTCNDLRGRVIAESCLDSNIRVPDDVAILGVDNDDLECELTHPPLSSVQIPWKEAGYRAAELLEDLMEGKHRKPHQHLIKPTVVVERQSTDTLAIADPDISAAIRFIRENAHATIGVDDILRVVPAARRSLEKRFRAILGRTVLEEIRRVHVECAKRLLVSTSLTMPDVADKSGFASAAWLSKTFRQLTGQTPTSYRRQFRSA